VVGEDDNLRVEGLQHRAPLGERVVDGKELLVVDFVVELRGWNFRDSYATGGSRSSLPT
jgi:hypothetical protein